MICNIPINYIPNCGKINKVPNIQKELYGQFIDYLIRYEICKSVNKPFYDYRAESVIKMGILNILINGLDSDKQKVFRELEMLDINILTKDFVKNKFDNKLDSKYNEYIHLIKKYKKICEFEQCIKNSLANLMGLNGTIKDVFNVSLTHSLYFNRIDVIQYINTIKSLDDMENLVSYLHNKIKNKKNILCNPILNNATIGIIGDADLIIDDELVEIKTSEKEIGNHYIDFIQPIIYACLYYINTKILCTQLTIFNPNLGYEYNIQLDETLVNKIVEILVNYKNWIINCQLIYKLHKFL